jgi:hypothetical protein
MKRHLLFILVVLGLACGTVQPGIIPEAPVLVSGFPSKPWPFQVRPGSDGKCPGGGPPSVIIKGSGCWVWVVGTTEECEATAKENAYFVPYEGRCYYAMLDMARREPTSSIEQVLEEPR